MLEETFSLVLVFLRQVIVQIRLVSKITFNPLKEGTRVQRLYIYKKFVDIISTNWTEIYVNFSYSFRKNFKNREN